MVFDSVDLDLESTVLVGLRYAVCIPVNATITAATVTFVAEGSDSGATTISIRADRTGDAASFASQSLTSRNLTSAVVPWVAPNFVRNRVYPSPDLSAVVSELVAATEWDGCGHVAFIMNSVGERDAWTLDGAPAKAPVLSITYRA